jgi:phosphoglycerate dehydrogenase-like enzyme
MHVVYFDSFNRRSTLAKAFEKLPDVILRRCVEQHELAEALQTAEVLLIGNRAYEEATAATILKHGQKLKWIQFTSSGLDNAHKFGLPPGVTITNAAGLRSGVVAEHAFALMLGVARRLQAMEHAKAREDWRRDESTPGIISLTGKHLLIVGLGAIGQDIARKAKAFDMTVTGISRTTSPVDNVNTVRPREQLGDACAEADVVVMSASFEPGQQPLLGRDAIDRMKPTAILVNIARGGLIDEPALIAALNEKRIAGAGLDVSMLEPLPAGHPLWKAEGALLTPHIAGAGSDESNAGLNALLADNMQRWLSGATLKHVVTQA